MRNRAISADAAEAVRLLRQRWTRLKYHAEQSRLWCSEARFKIVAGGRRSGKTELAKRDGSCAAVGNTRIYYDYPYWVVFAAPTRPQAKALYWQELKNLVPSSLIEEVNETDLTMSLWNTAQISVIGLDAAMRHEGRPIDRLYVDEFAHIKPHVWKTNLRPALSTPGRLGSAWLYGVPRGGRGSHFHQLHAEAKRPEMDDWDAFHWASADILDPSEIEAAMRDLDPLTYAQEYEASFVSFAGRAYYCYDGDVHAIERVTYRPELPLVFCLDFNRAPGVAVVVQEQVYHGKRPHIAPVVTAVIGEVWIPRDSNTRRVCDRLIEMFGHLHRGDVHLYGDPSGGVKGTSSFEGSDWDEVRAKMYKAFGRGAVKDYVQRSHPRERLRVNAVNSRLLTVDGLVHMLVDPLNAPHVCDDLESVTTIEGTAGEIDKNRDPNLTHLSDGLGYYVQEKHPIGEGQEWRHDDI